MRSLYTVGADSAYQPQFEIDEEDTAEMQPLVSSSLETCRFCVTEFTAPPNRPDGEIGALSRKALSLSFI